MKHKNKICFEINYRKSIEVILYILSKYEKQGLSLCNLLKMIFAADKYHLNQYASPVTGDTYIKMKYGTVPSEIKNILDKNQSTLDFIADIIIEYPFERLTSKHHLKGTRQYNENLLSESDIEALEFGIKEYDGLTFEEVKNKNHSEKCWKESILDSSIDFELIIENNEILTYLKEVSAGMVV